MFNNDNHEIIYITPEMMHKYYNNTINNTATANNNANNNTNTYYNNKNDININTIINQSKQIIFTIILCLLFIYILQ